jgi:hypothetical protein
MFRFLRPPWRHFARHLAQLSEEVFTMSVALDRLTAEVSEVKGVANSAVTLISSIPDLIRQAVAEANAGSGDLEAKVNALADDLTSAVAPLAAAIQANPAETDTQGGGNGADTVSGSNGNDTVSNGDDTLNGADSVEG